MINTIQYNIQQGEAASIYNAGADAEAEREIVGLFQAR